MLSPLLSLHPILPPPRMVSTSPSRHWSPSPPLAPFQWFFYTSFRTPPHLLSTPLLATHSSPSLLLFGRRNSYTLTSTPSHPDPPYLLIRPIAPSPPELHRPHGIPLPTLIPLAAHPRIHPFQYSSSMRSPPPLSSFTPLCRLPSPHFYPSHPSPPSHHYDPLPACFTLALLSPLTPTFPSSTYRILLQPSGLGHSRFLASHPSLFHLPLLLPFRPPLGRLRRPLAPC